MTVYLNGQPEELSSDFTTLFQLLSKLGVIRSAVSVSVNDIMVPCTHWKLRTLKEFDRIDFV